MDLLEHQAKQYLRRWAIPVPEGEIASSLFEAVALCDKLGYPVVLKAQVPLGGRGKLGGVRIVDNCNSAAEAASEILGMTIGSYKVEQLRVEASVDIASEHYVSFCLDRTERAHLAMVSPSGGIDVEEAALDDPTAIVKHLIDPLEGLSQSLATRLAQDAGFKGAVVNTAANVICRLYRAYVEGDADLVEVNPLIVTQAGDVVAVDAKVILDDNASFRHSEWAAIGEMGSLDPRETAAKARGLNYIGLNGTVGIIANGAGLAMTTLDLIVQAGGTAANFLDIGGGASAELMTTALQVVDSDPQVRAILINIFGGITRCDDIARGIVKAVAELDIKSSIVLRLEGTNSAEGQEILAQSTLSDLVSVADMVGAAAKAVDLAKEPVQ